MLNYKNLAIIYAPKGKDPETGVWNNKYLVPALDNQRCNKVGETNAVIVTCSPLYNGVYRYPAEKTSTYKTWKNGRTTCLYVPREDCSYEPLDSITDEAIIDEIKSQQDKWYKKEVKNQTYQYKGEKPEWMLK